MRYSNIEREFLAITKTLKNYRNILLGCELNIYTDNKNLINEKISKFSRVYRWKIIISEYNYMLNYIQGAKNIIADFLSRLNLKSNIQNNIFLLNDKKNVLNISTNNEDNIEAKIKTLHEYLGHPGIKTFYMTIKNDFKNIKIKKLITKTIKDCNLCQCFKNYVSKFGYVKENLFSDSPLEKISSDIVGLFNKKNSDEKIYLLTITDLCTRFSKVIIIKNINSETVSMKIYKEWFLKIKPPKFILTDLRKQYTSSKFSELCKKFQVKHIFSSPNNPTSNSISERINQQINTIMKMYYTKLPLTKILEIIHNRLNLVYNTTLKASPNELLFSKNYLDKKINNRDFLLEESLKSSKKISQKKFD
ncbi:Transposon Tf2-8 polyprotein [Dictyocoela muelleri]|nr:Transposon Tf2-8 polyprotein [Dictyocoela muelleri]